MKYRKKPVVIEAHRVPIEADDGETMHAEIATRAHRFKTPTHKAYRENRTRVAE